MATDPRKPAPAPPSRSAADELDIHRGVRIFSYPKIVFMYPTMIAAFVCALIMLTIPDRELNVKPGLPAVPAKSGRTSAQAQADAQAQAAKDPTLQSAALEGRPSRAVTIQNVAGLLFLGIFAFNLVVMSLDFPRFTIFAGLLVAAVAVFFLLWLSTFFSLIPPVMRFLEHLYAVANVQFYFLIGMILLVCYIAVYLTRFLDYWVILPNEILHNHGPFSDLERFPTFNLKFDKEIPDILEYAMLGSGRLVLHVANERRSIYLENVPWISHKEAELKRMMSSMEVRVSDDRNQTDE